MSAAPAVVSAPAPPLVTRLRWYNTQRRLQVHLQRALHRSSSHPIGSRGLQQQPHPPPVQPAQGAACFLAHTYTHGQHTTRTNIQCMPRCLATCGDHWHHLMSCGISQTSVLQSVSRGSAPRHAVACMQSHPQCFCTCCVLSAVDKRELAASRICFCRQHAPCSDCGLPQRILAVQGSTMQFGAVQARVRACVCCMYVCACVGMPQVRMINMNLGNATSIHDIIHSSCVDDG